MSSEAQFQEFVARKRARWDPLVKSSPRRAVRVLQIAGNARTVDGESGEEQAFVLMVAKDVSAERPPNNRTWQGLVNAGVIPALYVYGMIAMFNLRLMRRSCHCALNFGAILHNDTNQEVSKFSCPGATGRLLGWASVALQDQRYNRSM